MTKLRIELEVVVEDAQSEWGMRQVRDWVKESVDESRGERVVKVKREVLEEVPDVEED